MKGKGVVFTGRLKVSYQDVDIPEPLADEVVIDVEHSWISIGTESSFLRCDRIAGETPYREGDPEPFPQINGYQKVGVVVETGSQVQDFKPGDRVLRHDGPRERNGVSERRACLAVGYPRQSSMEASQGSRRRSLFRNGIDAGWIQLRVQTLTFAPANARS